MIKLFPCKGRSLLFIILSIAFAGACTIDLPYFMEVSMDGAPDYSNSLAAGISADGEVVVGSVGHPYPFETAFRWTKATGRYEIDPIYEASAATAISGDGTVVVGYQGDNMNPQAFWWTEASGLQLISGFYDSQASGVSSDGSVIVGSATPSNSPPNAFRWTAAGGVVFLGVLPCMSSSPCDDHSRANSVSADGKTIVGVSASSDNSRAFIWTQAGGMADLGHLPNYTNSEALDLSADGTTVVGYSSSGISGRSDSEEAFRWTHNGAMQGLGFLDSSQDNLKSRALGVSGDGAVIVGYCSTDSGKKAFLWRDGKMFDLQKLLVDDYGLNLDG